MIKQENLAIVTLKKGEGRTIKAGGAWVFNNEIETITGRFITEISCWCMILTVIRWEKATSIRIQKSACVF